MRWPCFSANFHGFQGIVVQVHQLYAPHCGKTRILAWRRCLPHVDVLKGSFFHSTSCRACRRQASVSLGAARMPTNLLHHGSQKGSKKQVETWQPEKELKCSQQAEQPLIYSRSSRRRWSSRMQFGRNRNVEARRSCCIRAAHLSPLR